MLDISPIAQRLAAATSSTWLATAPTFIRATSLLLCSWGATAPLSCAANRTPRRVRR
jgi:hypothetical protein